MFAVIGREGRSSTAVQRAASFARYFSGRGDIAVIAGMIDHVGDIRRQLRAFLAKNPALDGIFITNTCTYLYMNEIRRAFPGERPAIVGYDAVPRNRELLESGAIDCLLSQQPFSQGYSAVQQLYLHQVLGSRERTEKHAPVTVLFKETLASHEAIIRDPLM